MTFKKAFVLKLFAFTALMVSGQSPVRAETISEAIEAAIKAHPSIEEAYAIQQSLHEDANIERSGYYPTVSSSTAIGRVFGDNATSRGLSVTRGAGYSNLWEGSVSINQLLFDGLKTPRLIAAAESREKVAEASIYEIRNALALQTALAYLKVLRSRDSYMILKRYEAKLTDYRDKLIGMVENGGADKAEALEAEAILMQTENSIADFIGRMLRASAEYKLLTGHMPPETMFRPDDAKTLPENPDDALYAALNFHPQLKVADLQMEAAALTMKARKSALYPDLTAELSAYKKDVDDIIGGEVEDNRALIRANWDLSLGGAELADIKKAKYDHKQTNARKEQIIRELEQSINAAYADMKTSDLQRQILARRVEAEKELLEAQRLQFEGGKVRILKLQQSESRLLRSRLSLLEAYYSFLAAQYSILGSMGVIQEHLVQVSPLALNAKTSLTQ